MLAPRIDILFYECSLVVPFINYLSLNVILTCWLHINKFKTILKYHYSKSDHQGLIIYTIVGLRS